MNKMKMIKAIFLCIALLCGAMLGGCGEQNPEQTGTTGASQSTEASYQVKVTDALGNPYASGVVVRFMQSGEQVAMQVADETGVAAKTLEKGDYTVELMFTDTDLAYHYEQTDLTLTAEKTELEITLSYAVSGEAQLLNAQSPVTGQSKEYSAYRVSAGCTYVELSSEDRSLFLFAPSVAGTYEFTLIGSDAAIGYYGAPHFVQTINAAEKNGNTFTISVKADMIGTGETGTTILVIGVDPAEEPGAILTVERIGEPEYGIEDEPWTIYEATAALSPYTHNGAALKEFDLKASGDAYDLVLGSDGFYHLDSADGPLVLVRLGKSANGLKYIDPFETILERSGVTKYFFDENGEFVKKESYDQCLLQYFENMDANTGLYPLTEDLKYIIQQRGDYSGWWDESSAQYLFKNDAGTVISGINPEIAWLFMCCYAE